MSSGLFHKNTIYHHNIAPRNDCKFIPLRHWCSTMEQVLVIIITEELEEWKCDQSATKQSPSARAKNIYSLLFRHYSTPATIKHPPSPRHGSVGKAAQKASVRARGALHHRIGWLAGRPFNISVGTYNERNWVESGIDHQHYPHPSPSSSTASASSAVLKVLGLEV